MDEFQFELKIVNINDLMGIEILVLKRCFNFANLLIYSQR